MGKFTGVLLCTDIDGTLLSSDRTISKENRHAIEYFKSEGGLFTFVTGRMPYYAKDIYDTVHPNTAVGCTNGSTVYDFVSGNYLYADALPSCATGLMSEIVAALPDIGVQLNGLYSACFSHTNRATELYEAAIHYPHAVCKPEEFTEPLAKIVFAHLEKEKLATVAELLSKHKDFAFLRSESILYEVLPKGTHKGVALQHLAEHHGIPIGRTVALGDYDNDVGMLRTAGVGIAVKNATPLAKAAADRITVSNDEHAVARVIHDLLTGEIALS